MLQPKIQISDEFFAYLWKFTYLILLNIRTDIHINIKFRNEVKLFERIFEIISDVFYKYIINLS